MSYIYKIINDCNDKVYIGKTQRSLEIRFQEHLSDIDQLDSKNRPLYRSMRKYGKEHFSIQLIEECSSEQENEREKYWIEYYNSYKEGYNATIGGDGTSFYDYDLIVRTYNYLKNAQKTSEIIGCSVDTVLKVIKSRGISSKTIAKNKAKVNAKPVGMFSKETGELLKTFSSIRQAGSFLGKSHRHIGEVCRKERKSAYGYKWEFL